MFKKRFSGIDRCFYSKSDKKALRALDGKFGRCQINSKKAQVTIFIILGILLLLALAIIIAVKTELVTFKPSETTFTEKDRVENFLTSCLDSLGDEALELIGIQAGYVEVPTRIADNEDLHLKVSPVHLVPYWAYGVNTDIPELPVIKAQIDNHIKNNLRACLFDLEPFQKTYDIIEKSDIAVDTEIVDSKVIFNVRWDLEVRDKSGETISELNTHIAESQVKLKRVHETAKRIIEREMLDLKLEDLTQDLIALEHPHVPVAGLEISCRKKEWKADQAKTTLQDMIRVNLKELQVKGTEIIEYPKEFSYYENHYIWSLGEDFRMKNVNVVFNYENTYPFTFQVTPLNGNKMRSGNVGGQDMLKFLCIQNWKFTYDVSYPVLVRVQDETTGYNFNMALTVHLVRNMPNRQSEIVERVSIPTDYTTDRQFCQQNKIPMTVLTWELVDDGRVVRDPKPLGDVNVSFTCLKHSCNLGETVFDYADRGYEASGIYDLPYCVGGILRGKKAGYREAWTRVTTKNGETAELELVPLLEVPLEKIKVVKHELVGSELSPGIEITAEEIAYITLTFQKNDTLSLLTGEPFYKETIIVSPEFEADSPELGGDANQFAAVKFLAEADFRYDLEIFTFDEDNFIGGYQGKWKPPYDQLENAEEIVFHVLTKESGNDEELFELMLGLEDNSKLLPLPEIK